jgi:glycosyltransferase involved in cell wall biosynthesis
MRVACIVPSLDDTTGWGRWAQDFLRHIPRCGVEPMVLAPPSSRPHRPPSPDAPHFVLPEFFDLLQSSTGARRLPDLARLRFRQAGRLAAQGIRLVHSFEAHPWGLYGDWLARAAGVPHVLTTHGRYGYIARGRWLDRTLYAGVLRRAAGVVAVSGAVRQSVLRSFAGTIDPGKVCVIQNPVDASQFAPAGEAAGGDAAEAPVVVSVTRFIPVKDLTTAVRAFQKVRDRVPGASYYIIGPGNGPHNPYFRAVREVIEQGGSEGIHVVGRVAKADLAAYYRRASLLVHTARTLADDFEASGLILIEAGLFGLPVVASASGGIPEVVEDGVTGVLVEEGNVDRLAAAIVSLLGNPDERRRLGEGNRRLARSRNWPAYCEAQVEMYRRAVAG